MKKFGIFISSVQREFAEERHMLYDYLMKDALLSRFFDPFIFEQLPAKDQDATSSYLEQVRHTDIYLGIFGAEYGFEDKEGVSPTEREFDEATRTHKTRLIFVTGTPSPKRHPKQQSLVRKAEDAVVRKKFNSPTELRSAVY